MQLANLTWPKIDSLSRDTPILFPVAALEQHGHHMPVFTDSLLAGEIVRRLAEVPRFEQRILFAPLQWLGNSDHHLDFPGTLSAPPRVYLDLLAASIENFLVHGFKRFVFLNGHGGNDVPGKQVVFELRQKHRKQMDLLLLFATYWNLAPDVKKTNPDFAQYQMGHACEWETSMMLRIRPELIVGEVSKLETVPFGNAFEPASRGWTTKDRTVPGHIGSPQHATAEKGERLFQHFTAGATALLDRVLAWDGQSWDG
jgi:creatinine amidohydrolase